MPIAKRILVSPVKKAQRRVGRTGSKLFQAEIKGHTSDFDGALDPVNAQKKTVDVQTTSIISDPFVGMYELGATGNQPIRPMYDFNMLAALVQKSNILRQCIEAYVVNIESFGYTLEYIGPEGEEGSEEAKAEKVRLESFLALPNAEQSLRTMRERSRWDMETYGARAFEIIRNPQGEITSMVHVPSFSLRMTRREADPVMVEVSIPNPADPSQTIDKTLPRFFCRYVQLTASGMRRVYFKEFGDPRSIDPTDGTVNDTLSIEDQATEILYLNIYTPGHIYGLPRWIGNVPAILGSRESEMVNLNFFRENAIPAMAVLISGGTLTQDSFEIIEQYLNQVKGQKAMQRILLLEASADDTAGSVDHGPTAPKIDMKPMISERQQEGLFQDYDQKNQQKIRSSFRLPPIYAGRAEDYTRASAQASILTAENQIFIPERQAFDDIMNTYILRSYNPRFWRYKSMGVPVTDPESLATMLEAFEKSGALTPNIVIKIANKMLGVDIKPVMEDWGDYPFSAVMSYINKGAMIEGLDDFVKEIMNAVGQGPANKPDAIGGKKKPAAGKTPAIPAKTKKLVEQEILTIAQEIRDRVVSSLQVPATRAAE